MTTISPVPLPSDQRRAIPFTTFDAKPEGPQPIMRPIPPGAPYPVEALGPLRAAVEAAHDITQTPIAAPAQSALAVASLAVQGHADVETLGGYKPTSLFCLTSAESGDRKSANDKLFMGAFREHERELEAAYAADLPGRQSAREVWELKRKRAISSAANADRDAAIGAEADLAALGSEPRLPLLPFRLAQEPTLEGLVKLYLGGQPSLGIFSDEAGGLIGGHAMNADNKLKTISGLTKLFDGSDLNRTRAGDGAATLRDRRLAIHLLGQPEVIRILLSDRLASGQGFLPRFLTVELPDTGGTFISHDESPKSRPVIDAFGRRLSDILAVPMPVAETNPQELRPRKLPMSPDARTLLRRFHDAVEVETAPGRSMARIKPHARRTAEQAARIAGVLTLWGDLNAAEVSAEAMGSGVELAQFYLSEALRLAEAGSVSDESAKAETLRHWLRDVWKPNDITVRDVVNYGPNRLRESKAARATMTVLVNHGWLVPLPEGTETRGVRRREVFAVVRGDDAF